MFGQALVVFVVLCNLSTTEFVPIVFKVVRPYFEVNDRMSCVISNPKQSREAGIDVGQYMAARHNECGSEITLSLVNLYRQVCRQHSMRVRCSVSLAGYSRFSRFGIARHTGWKQHEIDAELTEPAPRV